MSPSRLLVNDVPMKGKGFYNSNSALQNSAMLRALPLLESATKATAATRPDQTRLFSAVEYGSSQGNNSIEPFSLILRNIPSAGQAQIIFSDRQQNDFSSLATTISEVDWTLSTDLQTVFTSMVPQSFYEPVIPPNSADLGFSFACLHHLDHVPDRPAGQLPTDPERKFSLRTQAHADLKQFLNLRAAEITPGGSLVVSFVAQAASGEQNYAGPVDACRTALVEMITEGLIPAEVAMTFEVPTYNRSVDEVKACLAEVGGDWDAKEVFEEKIAHPAVQQLARRQAENGVNEDDSASYAATVMDWLMAVVAGYFTKALQIVNGDKMSAIEGEEILDELIRRSKKAFFKSHRDEEVACWFIYVVLERK